MNKGFFRWMGALGCALALLAFLQRPVDAASTTAVYMNGVQLRFDSVQPVLEDGWLLVPFQTLFEALGCQAKRVDAGGMRKVIGTKAGMTVELTIDSRTATADGSSFDLDVPARMIKGNAMVPLRFAAEHSGYRVHYAAANGAATVTLIEIGRPEGSGKPDQDIIKAEPNVVQGYARDSQGKALMGVSVYAEHQLAYTGYPSAVTDANGYYRIELPDLATTWRVSSAYAIALNGAERPVSLKPDNDEAFESKTGAVRDFTLEAGTR